MARSVAFSASKQYRAPGINVSVGEVYVYYNSKCIL
jgi:hypothetical protein